jgi:HEPN domain-containing protein
MYADPQSDRGWRDVATERSTDTLALQDARRSVAALYMLGFAVECHAKALCAAAGRAIPKSHDLIKILEQAGFRRTDLPVELREFAETRDVGLRYQAALPSTIDLEEQLKRGQTLAGWCRRRLNRPSRPARPRK